MSVLKIKTNGQWRDLAGVSSHTHSKNEITDFPTSLPANGGNADTVDGLHAEDFVMASDIEQMIQNQIDEKVDKTVVDGELSEDSENPVQNKVVSAAISELNGLVGDSSVDDQINTYLKPNGVEKYALATDLANINKQMNTIYIGSDTPTDSNIQLWIDPSDTLTNLEEVYF